MAEAALASLDVAAGPARAGGAHPNFLHLVNWHRNTASRHVLAQLCLRQNIAQTVNDVPEQLSPMRPV